MGNLLKPKYAQKEPIHGKIGGKKSRCYVPLIGDPLNDKYGEISPVPTRYFLLAI
jgi:hypothetical protein